MRSPVNCRRCPRRGVVARPSPGNAAADDRRTCSSSVGSLSAFGGTTSDRWPIDQVGRLIAAARTSASTTSDEDPPRRYGSCSLVAGSRSVPRTTWCATDVGRRSHPRQNRRVPPMPGHDIAARAHIARRHLASTFSPSSPSTGGSSAYFSTSPRPRLKHGRCVPTRPGRRHRRTPGRFTDLVHQIHRYGPRGCSVTIEGAASPKDERSPRRAPRRPAPPAPSDEGVEHHRQHCRGGRSSEQDIRRRGTSAAVRTARCDLSRRRAALSRPGRWSYQPRRRGARRTPPTSPGAHR